MTAASALASDEYEADAALVLLGYGGETLFPTTESVEANANQAFGVLSALSLGNVSSYKIFDGGIDLRTVDSILAAQEITVIYEALSWWQFDQYIGFLESHKGRVLVDPTGEEIAILEEARAWLVENQTNLFGRLVWDRLREGASLYILFWANDKTFLKTDYETTHLYILHTAAWIWRV